MAPLSAHSQLITPPAVGHGLQTFGFGFSSGPSRSCASRIVSSFVSRASSKALFCFARPMPKNEAMLSGRKFAERRSRGEVGDKVRRGLQASPGRSYLAGAAVRVIWVKDMVASQRSGSGDVCFVCCCGDDDAATGPGAGGGCTLHLWAFRR